MAWDSILYSKRLGQNAAEVFRGRVCLKRVTQSKPVLFPVLGFYLIKVSCLELPQTL